VPLIRSRVSGGRDLGGEVSCRPEMPSVSRILRLLRTPTECRVSTLTGKGVICATVPSLQLGPPWRQLLSIGAPFIALPSGLWATVSAGAPVCGRSTV
jgi:hypothetical protein